MIIKKEWLMKTIKNDSYLIVDGNEGMVRRESTCSSLTVNQ